MDNQALKTYIEKFNQSWFICNGVGTEVWNIGYRHVPIQKRQVWS